MCGQLETVGWPKQIDKKVVCLICTFAEHIAKPSVRLARDLVVMLDIPIALVNFGWMLQLPVRTQLVP